MDENNIAFHVEGGKVGYPAGGWGEAVLGELFPEKIAPKELDARFVALVEIYNRADDRHGRDLDAIMPPGTRQLLVSYWDGRISRDRAIRGLTSALRVLPYLLFAGLPQVRNSVLIYGNSQQAIQE